MDHARDKRALYTRVADVTLDAGLLEHCYAILGGEKAIFSSRGWDWVSTNSSYTLHSWLRLGFIHGTGRLRGPAETP